MAPTGFKDGSGWAGAVCNPVGARKTQGNLSDMTVAGDGPAGWGGFAPGGGPEPKKALHGRIHPWIPTLAQTFDLVDLKMVDSRFRIYFWILVVLGLLHILDPPSLDPARL